MHDVLVLGGGLAGLSAARDLAAAGADVLVLEARHRPGGRVEQVDLPDGRRVQLGGELVGRAHHAYLALVEELGLTLEASYLESPGVDATLLAEGVRRGEWLTPGEREAAERMERAFSALARSVDPDDPWGHPDAAALDAISLAAWLRAQGAPPAVVRERELFHLGLAGGSAERLSLLSELRKASAAGAGGFYDLESWESLRVAEGSATVAVRMAAELGDRVRLGAPVRRFTVAPARCVATLRDGEELRAEAIVSALPVGPLRALDVRGVSAERLASLQRQRNAAAAKLVAVFDRSVWLEGDSSGVAYGEGMIGSSWPQGPGILSMLVGPERLGLLMDAAGDAALARDAGRELAALFGEHARRPASLLVRRWGLDPWTLGYITQWRPGDVLAVGPLHGTHEPPFYVCGSDQWVAGYMEGAVRTGRAAAAAALGREPAAWGRASAGPDPAAAAPAPSSAAPAPVSAAPTP